MASVDLPAPLPPEGRGWGGGPSPHGEGPSRDCGDAELRARRIGGPLNGKLAQKLRRDQTGSERQLWKWLRTLRASHGLHLRRQAPIGRFIADFVCHSKRLVIELDGRLHDPIRDRARDAWFLKVGYRTLRFKNEHLLEQPERVFAEIEFALGVGERLEGPLAHLQTPTPDPSPQGGGDR